MKPNWKLFKNILTRCSRSHNPTTEQGSKGKPGTDGSQRGHKKTRGKRKRGHDKWNKGESSGWQREIWCWDVQGLIWEARDPWWNCRLLQFIHDFFFFSFWEHLKIQWLLSLKGEFLEVSKARLEGTTWDGRGGIYEIYEMRFMVQNHSGNPWFYFFFPWRTGKKISIFVKSWERSWNHSHADHRSLWIAGKRHFGWAHCPTPEMLVWLHREDWARFWHPNSKSLGENLSFPTPAEAQTGKLGVFPLGSWFI